MSPLFSSSLPESTSVKTYQTNNLVSAFKQK